ncbi:MAG: calcium/sodium antiporter [Minisyncoccus archaeiphilus]|jgi:cation:H+ antiporter|uniref:calcium/sodium antiporter n=1 Tax=Minisyncoccus archaeiphilus TaxID=3238481 RepID=UPI002B0D43D2|nr:MAG: calcium/sodium antiporter [Candidatus Parcubacteria bacterium]
MIILSLLLLVAGFIFLIKGANLLVDGSSSIAKKMGVSDLVIGLTIVSFGTSAPELIVNVFASVQGNADIAIGNVLGSNIMNILLILGVTSLLCPLKVHNQTIWKEIPFSLLAALVLGIIANDYIFNNGISSLALGDGLILLLFFSIFLVYVFEISKKGKIDAIETGNISPTRASIYVIIGLIGLVAGGKMVVDGAVDIARAMSISESIIGLTIVAIGTSLPELVTSVIAALKKNADMAIGNVIGSNIFNIFFILGISSVINPIPYNAYSNTDILFTIFASFLLFIVMFVGKKHILERSQGAAFLLVYLIYTILLFYRA